MILVYNSETQVCLNVEDGNYYVQNLGDDDILINNISDDQSFTLESQDTYQLGVDDEIQIDDVHLCFVGDLKSDSEIEVYEEEKEKIEEENEYVSHTEEAENISMNLGNIAATDTMISETSEFNQFEENGDEEEIHLQPNISKENRGEGAAILVGENRIYGEVRLVTMTMYGGKNLLSSFKKQVEYLKSKKIHYLAIQFEDVSFNKREAYEFVKIASKWNRTGKFFLLDIPENIRLLISPTGKSSLFQFYKEKEEILEHLYENVEVGNLDVKTPSSNASKTPAGTPVDFTEEEINGYFTKEKIAIGNFSSIYKAVNKETKEIVALKILHPYLYNREFLAAHYNYQSQILPSINHPNINKIFGSFEENGVYGFVMKWIQGKNLDELLSSNVKFELKNILHLIIQLGKGLSYLHSNRIICRDVSPSNIMINDEEQPIIVDLELARIFGEKRVTQEGIVVGRPSYMSPKSFEGSLSVLDDQYSLGVVLYEILTKGQIPFGETEGTIELYKKRLSEEPTSISKWYSDVDENLEKIVLKSIARKEEDRFASINEMIEALENLELEK